MEGQMKEPIFDHEKLDVYRVSIAYITRLRGVVKSLSGIDRPIRDQWMRAAQSMPLNIAEGNGKESLKDKNRFFEIARGSALECAAIHDVLAGCGVIDRGVGRQGKAELKRIVSMLTRLIQRSNAVREDRFEYEYEYRDAEYETE
jgi:four helix bundle protein